MLLKSIRLTQPSFSVLDLHPEDKKNWTKGMSINDGAMDSNDVLSFNYVLPDPPPTSKIWHKVNFKQSIASLNLEFSFSYTNCLTRAKEHSLPQYLSVASRKMNRSMTFALARNITETVSFWISATKISSSKNNILLQY